MTSSVLTIRRKDQSAQAKGVLGYALEVGQPRSEGQRQPAPLTADHLNGMTHRADTHSPQASGNAVLPPPPVNQCRKAGGAIEHSRKPDRATKRGGGFSSLLAPVAHIGDNAMESHHDTAEAMRQDARELARELEARRYGYTPEGRFDRYQPRKVIGTWLILIAASVAFWVAAYASGLIW